MYERIVICEGEEDKAFLDALCQDRNIGPFQFQYVGELNGKRGKDALVHHLTALIGLRDFKRTCQHIVYVADSEENRDETFQSICSAIKNANNSDDVNNFYNIPKEPMKTSKGSPFFTVILQPLDETRGCLESVLWRALQRLYPRQTACVEALISCTEISQASAKWTKAKIDKARVHAAIATINKMNPSLSVSYLWKRSPNLLPLDIQEFNDIASALFSIE